MLLRKTLILLFLLFCCAKGFSATFVVTSNADSGPGTLRDALTQAAANGTAEMDYINFNLPDQSEAGRTITIASQLPYISSNLVIDGTTQPGMPFGVSNAKVILQPITSSSPFNALLMIDASGFEIYGMYIRDFRGKYAYGEQGVDVGTAALYVETSDNIQIGAPGKGNVFVNNNFVVFTDCVTIKGGANPPAYGVNNLTVLSNFFGVEPDGKTSRGYYGGGLDLNYCKGNIQIGGPDVVDRNIFNNISSNISGFYTGPDRLFPSDFLIQNNYFGYDVNGNPVPFLDTNGGGDVLFFNISRWIFPDEYGKINYPYSFTILNNKIQYPYSSQVSYVTKPIIYQGNVTLYEPSTYRPFGYTAGIGLASSDIVKVGGVNPGEANIIYGEGLWLNSPKSILVQRNSIYCINVNGTYVGAPPNPIYTTNTYQDPKLPVINISSVTANSISGTATPLSVVELFQDDDCVWCEPLTYFATVDADANGNWSYSGPINKGVIASATVNGYTSLFTSSGWLNGLTVTNSSCGNNNGALTGFLFSNSGGYQITDVNNNIISTNTDAKNLAPGTYIITTKNGTCSSKFSYQVLDATPVINSNYANIVQPSCGNNNGSITNLFLGGNNSQIQQSDFTAYTYQWLDANNNLISSSMDATNLKAGTYHLEVSYKHSCTTTYGPITLKNTTGPNIDQSNAKIQSTNCGQTTGSVTNLIITGTGTLKYTWTNSQQQVVGTDKDLTNQPAGTYKLKVTDDSQCGPVYSADIAIPETNGITIDETNAQPHPASCGNGNGSVTGIAVTGATTYQWTDAGNKIVGSNPDLTNVVAGTYLLTASNTTGCSKTSKTYTVIEKPATIYPTYNYTIVKTCPHYPTGSISITTDNLVTAYRWINSAGMPYGNTPEIDNLPADTYILYLTDANGCETLYNTFKVPVVVQLGIVAGTETITNDQCGNGKGAISGVQITGGTEPYIYYWRDANGTLLSNTANLSNVPAGTYKLNVHDASNCGDASASYTVANNDNVIDAPSVSNIQLCSSGGAIIAVNNALATGIYRLYDSESSTTPADQQTGGKFKVDVSSNTSFYITQVNGTCESAKAKIDITVGLSTLSIANTFTPNGDGINDYWKINNIENYPQAVVQVFTRYGQKVFESKGYQLPFDGTYKGQNLPAGVYYFIINLHSNCSLLSGSLTILR